MTGEKIPVFTLTRFFPTEVELIGVERVHALLQKAEEECADIDFHAEAETNARTRVVLTQSYLNPNGEMVWLGCCPFCTHEQLHIFPEGDFFCCYNCSCVGNLEQLTNK